MDSPIDRVNLRTASADVIHALTGIPLEKSRRFIDERKKLSDKTLGDLLPLLGIGASDAALQQFVFANPAVVTVEAEGRPTESRLSRRVKGVVRAAGGGREFELMRWIDRDIGIARDDQEPDFSGDSASSSQQAAQASAMPRPFGVVGRWKAPEPGLSPKPSLPASAARCEPPLPSSADQIRIARSLARSCLPSASRAPRDAGSSQERHLVLDAGACAWAARSQRSTIGARSETGSSPSTTTSSASRIAESGRR